MMHDFWQNIIDEVRAKQTSYSAAQIATTVKAVQAMQTSPKDPNKIPTLWDKPKNMPDISMVDFGDVEFATPVIKNLLASNTWLKKDRLIWHVKNPGKALHNNPFTTLPMVCTTNAGMTIIDGHHRLAALMLLGAKSTQVNNLPMN